MNMSTHPLPTPTAVPCRNCGKLPECATNFFQDRGPPRPGDVLICCYCDDLTVVGDDGQRRAPTKKEAKMFAADDRIVRLIDAQRMMRVLRQ